MKKLVMAATAALALTATSAAALDYSSWATGAYSVEAQALAINAGIDVSVYEGLTVTPQTFSSYNGDFSFDGIAVDVEYTVNDNLSVFTTISADENLSYADTIIGITINF